MWWARKRRWWAAVRHCTQFLAVLGAVHLMCVPRHSSPFPNRIPTECRPPLDRVQAFAECRPMRMHSEDGVCVDDETWQCPLSWMGVLPVAVSPPPPSPPAVCQGLSADFGGCYESRCCATAGFGCFKRVGKVRPVPHAASWVV